MAHGDKNSVDVYKRQVYELYMLDGILTNSEGEKFELSIENAVNPETGYHPRKYP